MTIGPVKSVQETLKSAELESWKTPKELEGTVVNSFEELKRLFPADEKFGGIFENHGNAGFCDKIKAYSRNMKISSRIRTNHVAYECSGCNKIVVGPPEIKVEDSMGTTGGQEGLRYYCTNCNQQLAENIWGHSL